MSLHAKFEDPNIFPSILFNFWHISLIIHENDVIMDVMPKKRACSTCTIILWTQCHKNRRKKLFVENLHAAVTYPLHYINPSLSNLKPYSFCELTQYPVQMSGIKYILISRFCWLIPLWWSKTHPHTPTHLHRLTHTHTHSTTHTRALTPSLPSPLLLVSPIYTGYWGSSQNE